MIRTNTQIKMIISHKYKFIFIKTRKTAGSSIQIYLSPLCDEQDIFTQIDKPEQPYTPRNFRGLYNPIPELIENWQSPKKIMITLGRFLTLKKFQSHIKAREVKDRISHEIWNTYYRFCIERNPWDKVLSHYHFVRQRYRRYNNNISFDKYLRVAELPYNYTKYTDINGNIIVDSVIKYENLNEELGKVFIQLGIPFNDSLCANEKAHYRTDKRPYQEVYSEKQKLLVEKLFEKEIQMHGYEF